MTSKSIGVLVQNLCTNSRRHISREGTWALSRNEQLDDGVCDAEYGRTTRTIVQTEMVTMSLEPHPDHLVADVRRYGLDNCQLANDAEQRVPLQS